MIRWLLYLPYRLTRKQRLARLSRNWTGNPYYPCSCTHCGWVGSSRLLDGGNQTWDGDYEEIFCPRCGANEEKIWDH
jgi:hypothetical protein